MGNDTCLKCGFTSNAWWHKAANETDPPVVHPKVHPFESEWARDRALREANPL